MKSFTEYKYDYGSPESVKLMKKVTPGQNEAIVDPRDLRGRPKKPDSHPDSPYGRKHPLHPANLAKKNNKKTKTEATWPDEMPNEELDEAMKQTHIVINSKGKVIGYATDEKGAKDLSKNNIRKEKGAVVKLKKPISDKKAQDMMGGNLTIDMLNKLREEVDEATWPDEMPNDVDEALNLQQRMKRSRLMKRLKTRIKIGRQRAMRKMANKKTLEKRSNRQARNQIAKKLTRGIPKSELTFARKQEIEKRLDKPALKQRIARLAKRMFKDVRKKEVQRKKG